MWRRSTRRTVGGLAAFVSKDLNPDLSETIMHEGTADTRRIAEEAVGERLEDAQLNVPKQNVARAPEDLVTSGGPQPSLAAKTAESVGEREAGAYADATVQEARRRSRASVGRSPSQRQAARWLSNQFGNQPFVVISAFGLGYLAALIIHHRR